MSRLAVRLGRRPLLFGFAAALLPVLFLVGLQLWWLFKLHRTSVVAGQAVLAGFLDAVVTEVLYSYGPAAERTLDVPASYFAQDRLEQTAGFFRRKDVEGVKRLFVARFSSDDRVTILVYDPENAAMQPVGPSDETRAITGACAPWKLMHASAVQLDVPRLFVEEREPENRIISRPITDAGGRIVGVAGLVLDARWFAGRLLPTVIGTQMPKFFPRGAEEAVVSVRDGSGALRFTTDPGDNRSADATRPFQFVFTDMRIGVRNRGLAPRQLARLSLGFNLTLSVLASALVIGGLAFLIRTAAREVRLSEMKSNFVSNVSHELRTPLASIRVFGEFLRHGRATTPEKVREYGEYIEAESRRLTQLIDNLLDFARIESGRKVYRFIPGDVTEVMATTVAAFRMGLRDTGFEIAFRRPEAPLPPVPLDADALGQAFHNLVDNAVKYSGDSRWIGVGIERRDAEIVVTVEDRGIGVSRDEQARIFDRFHRVGTGLVHDVRGTGLGLAIVKHVAEAHGGRVTVASEPGRGSVFSVHLPVPLSAETANRREPGRGDPREQR